MVEFLQKRIAHYYFLNSQTFALREKVTSRKAKHFHSENQRKALQNYLSISTVPNEQKLTGHA